MQTQQQTTYLISFEGSEHLALFNTLDEHRHEGRFNFGIEQGVMQKLTRTPTSPRLTRQEIVGCVMHLEAIRDARPADPERTDLCNRLISKLEAPTKPGAS